MKSINTLALVLRRTNFGEADRILQLITPLGKKSVMAKGVRREKSKLAGGIELFAVSKVCLAEGKGELGVLTSARLQTFYRNIMSDYDRLTFGYESLSLVSKASENIDSSEWFGLLDETLWALDAGLDMRLIKTWFYLRFSDLHGYALSLWLDTSGQKMSADDKYRYDVSDKGLALDQNGDLSADHIKLLRLIATKPLRILKQIGGVEEVLADCLQISSRHVAIY
jgi:DNA repair protein RecO (recombination protein O)